MTQQNEITVVDETDAFDAALALRDPQTLFTSNATLNNLLFAIKEASVLSSPDVSTAKGRKEIASMAAKVAKAKARIDECGKDYVAVLKELPKTVDAGRKYARDYLDDLKEQVRAPLTAWEAEEQAKEDAARALAERLQAERELEDAHELAILLNEKFDRERAEQLRLSEARMQEHKLRMEAEAKERAEADAKAAIEAAERAAQEAEARAKRAEDEAAERAVRAAETARLEEQRRQDDERRKAKAEQEAVTAGNIARAQDAEHRKTVNREALADLMKLGLTEEHGKAVIVGIAQGKVSYIRIAY